MADIQGVDVASFQGTPHSGWPNETPFEWAAVKFTEFRIPEQGGLYQDPDAKADWDYLKANGKGRIAYLFGHPNTDPKATVEAFSAMLNSLGLDAQDGIALDLEVADGRTPAEVASWARVVVDLLKAAFGRTVILYTFLDFARTGNCEGLEGCYLWIANPSRPAGDPEVPAPWKDWAFHQYSQAGNLDRDVAHFSTLAAMRAAIGKPVYQIVRSIHVTTGTETFEHLEKILACGMSTMLRITAESAPNGEFTEPFATYINEGNFALVMPKGIAVHYEHRVRV